MSQDIDFNLPIELSPVPRIYVIASAAVAIGAPAVLWIVALAQRQPFSMKFLAVAPVSFVLMVLYIRNITVRLSETGICKGLPIVGTSIPFERIGRVSKETLLQRGSPPAFVVSERDSGKRIVIPVFNFDRTELARLMGALSRRAPQAQIAEEVEYIQLRTNRYSNRSR